MKKILFFVLIAIAVSTVVEQTEENDVALEAFNWRDAWNAVKGVVKKAIDWLKEKGLYTPIVNAIKSKGQAYGKSVCESKGVPGDVCSQIVKYILDHVL